MADVAHYFGNDLSLSAAGDLAVATGSQLGRQRVLRRLLTNPGDYIWHQDYGAGLPAKVGSLATSAELRGLVLSQILLEAAVAQDPAPVVTVTAILNGQQIYVGYTDAFTGDPVQLNFRIDT